MAVVFFVDNKIALLTITEKCHSNTIFQSLYKQI